MILRVVKMEFKPESLSAFDTLFNQVHAQIEAMPGCSRVQLLKGSENTCLRTTLSWWENTEDLDAYRRSELFGQVWPQTKAMFQSPPVAWSSDWP